MTVCRMVCNCYVSRQNVDSGMFVLMRKAFTFRACEMGDVIKQYGISTFESYTAYLLFRTWSMGSMTALAGYQFHGRRSIWSSIFFRGNWPKPTPVFKFKHSRRAIVDIDHFGRFSRHCSIPLPVHKSHHREDLNRTLQQWLHILVVVQNTQKSKMLDPSRKVVCTNFHFLAGFRLISGFCDPTRMCIIQQTRPIHIHPATYYTLEYLLLYNKKGTVTKFSKACHGSDRRRDKTYADRTDWYLCIITLSELVPAVCPKAS